MELTSSVANVTYIRVQYARLLSGRLDIRNRRLKYEVLIQPPVQSLERKYALQHRLLLCVSDLVRTWPKAFPCDRRRWVGKLPLPVFLF